MTQIGPATTYGKEKLYNTTRPFHDLIDNYVLFGDPAMIIDLPAPDVWVEKQATPPGPWLAGQAITYTIAYGNSGSAVAVGVRLTDTLPAELTGSNWTASDPAVAGRIMPGGFRTSRPVRPASSR